MKAFSPGVELLTIFCSFQKIHGILNLLYTLTIMVFLHFNKNENENFGTDAFLKNHSSVYPCISKGKYKTFYGVK